MLQVARDQWRQIFPNAPSAVMDAFAAKHDVFEKAGILATRPRLAFFCANVEHECGGFTIRNLTENIMYTAARMAVVWSNRFGSAGAVIARYGSAPGWQLKAFDDIYGSRMGNRPGTHDGSTFIGRGGPQVTGRDGYNHVGERAGRNIVDSPTDASNFELQPEICAAFWTWKNLNHFADAGDFIGCVKMWNGGTNGFADRKTLMAGNNPIIARLANIDATLEVINSIDAPLAPAQHPLGNVVWVQSSLNKLSLAGVMRLPALLEIKSGIYGTKTRDAVEMFQRKFNVTPFDGIAGSKTTAAIANQISLHALA